jgi:hypothetical protein
MLVGVSDANIRPSYMFDDIGGSVRTLPLVLIAVGASENVWDPPD